jgi:hypothetical protein
MHCGWLRQQPERRHRRHQPLRPSRMPNWGRDRFHSAGASGLGMRLWERTRGDLQGECGSPARAIKSDGRVNEGTRVGERPGRLRLAMPPLSSGIVDEIKTQPKYRSSKATRVLMPSMPQRCGPLHDCPEGRAAHDSLPPRLYVGVLVYVNLQELEHPRHRKGKVRDVGQYGPVGDGNIVLARKGEPFFENVPLLHGIFVQPVPLLLACRRRLDRGWRQVLLANRFG